MTKNPCATCEFGDQDKLFNKVCTECEKRIEYLNKIEAGDEDMVFISIEKRKKSVAEKPIKQKLRAAPETKICKRPGCVFEGEPQPAKSFYKREDTKDGLDYVCKKCKLKMEKDARHKREDKELKRIENEFILTLDFTKYPDIYKALVKASDECFRTPVMQAIFLLKGVLGSHD